MKHTWKENFKGERALSLILAALLLGMAGCEKTEVTLKAEEAAEQPAKASWWEGYTTIATDPLSGKWDDLESIGAEAYRSVRHGGWYGSWFHDFSEAGTYAATAEKSVLEAGGKPLAYYDAGEIGDFAMYVSPENKPIVNGWSWHTWDGQKGSFQWFGLESFMNDVAWAPYPTAKDYGIPAFTMPDGSPIPEGQLYDVLAMRHLDNTWQYMWSGNANISDDLALTTGLSKHSQRLKGPADVQGGSGWATARITYFDKSNPQMLEFMKRDVAEQVRRFRPAGILFDNFSAQPYLISPPVHSFGMWSEHTFREFLRQHMTKAELAANGINDLDTFEIRTYMLQDYKEGDMLGGPHLRNARWLDDPIWGAYKVHRTNDALNQGRELYRAAKEAASEEGLDLLVCGNIIPMFPGAELTDGFCDVAHFEALSVGSFSSLPECGLPPQARTAYFVRLGKGISNVSYCWPSLYVPKRLTGPEHVNLHSVQALSCFSNGGIMDYGQWYLGNYSPGTDKSAGRINQFIQEVAPRTSGRDFAADIGVVYGPWSLMATIDGQGIVPELFINEYKGWTDYLCNSHQQWDVIFNQKLPEEDLAQFDVLILPSILSIDDEQVASLKRFVDQGGHLVITGLSGTRTGPDEFLVSRKENALAGLRNHPGVHWTETMPGADYLSGKWDQADKQTLDRLIAFKSFTPSVSTDASSSVEVNLWKQPGKNEYTLDLMNNQLDPETDVMTPAPASRLSVHLKDWPRGKSLTQLEIITVDQAGHSGIQDFASDHWSFDSKAKTLELNLPSFGNYLMVFID